MAKDKFLRGALILTLAGLMVKIIGSVNRILLSRLLGGEGIGLYQMAYPVYLLMISVSSAGIPIAISIIVAEKVAQGDYGSAKRIFRITLALMACTGLVFALILYGVAGWLVDNQIIRDGRAYYALVALTPAVFFATILASFRGYFQGYQLMTPTGVSQILEQLVRVVTMVVMAYYLLPYGLEYAAAGAAFGAVPGSVTGLVVLSWFYLHYHKQWAAKISTQKVMATESVTKIAARLIKLALPVSCANIMVPVVTGIDMLIVPHRLELAGFSVVEATTLFGYLAGMALPLVMMATIPTISLAASIVPAITEAFALNNLAAIRQRSATALRLCFLLTFPATVGMWILSKPISQLLYGTTAASSAIAHLAPSIALLGLHQVTTGILQGLGMTVTPMLNMLFSAAVKVFLVWELTALPEYGIVGAAWATNLNFGLAALLNIFFLCRYTDFVLPWRATVNILTASLVMGLCGALTYEKTLAWGSANTVSTLLAMLVCAVIYGGSLLVSGEFTAQEIRKVPYVGVRLVVILQKIKVVRDEK
ncbi:MAG: polysaccharide biosynthesis protein [Acidaminococcaceae bacterium]